MIRRRLFIKADRMFKKPKPGKKRLVKWPHKLVPLYDDKARTLHSHATPFLHWLEIIRQTHRAQCTSSTSMPWSLHVPSCFGKPSAYLGQPAGTINVGA